jgi:predicted GH43/DUF377 family glycosyl hydrolase
MLKRYAGNPILKPIKEHGWESLMVYNCAVIELGGKVHIVYRAQGIKGGISRFGYASTKDGFKIDERLAQPIFCPGRENDLESFGCEDPRLTRIGDRIYMCYTAYGIVPGMKNKISSIQIGLSSISQEDFLNHRWHWSEPIYPFFRVDNKNSFLFPEKIKGRWVMYHRIPPHIWVAYSDDLKNWTDCKIVMSPQEDWEYFKLGAGAPALKTEEGWLFIYHAVDRAMTYRLGLALIDLEDPEKIIKRSKVPLLEPKEKYEKEGVVPNVTFSCGAVIRDKTLFLYYGGADTVICVATAKVSDLLHFLAKTS